MYLFIIFCHGGNVYIFNILYKYISCIIEYLLHREPVPLDALSNVFFLMDFAHPNIGAKVRQFSLFSSSSYRSIGNRYVPSSFFFHSPLGFLVIGSHNFNDLSVVFAYDASAVEHFCRLGRLVCPQNGNKYQLRALVSKMVLSKLQNNTTDNFFFFYDSQK